MALSGCVRFVLRHGSHFERLRFQARRLSLVSRASRLTGPPDNPLADHLPGLRPDSLPLTAFAPSYTSRSQPHCSSADQQTNRPTILLSEAGLEEVTAWRRPFR